MNLRDPTVRHRLLSTLSYVAVLSGIWQSQLAAQVPDLITIRQIGGAIGGQSVLLQPE